MSGPHLFSELCDWESSFLFASLSLVPSFSSSSVPATPWKSWSYSGSGSCSVLVGGPGDCRDWNRARPRLRLPKALGLGRLRTDAFDDCLENWRENWRPRGRVGGRFVQRNSLGPNWVGEQQTVELVLEIQRKTLTFPLVQLWLLVILVIPLSQNSSIMVSLRPEFDKQTEVRTLNYLEVSKPGASSEGEGSSPFWDCAASPLPEDSML